ncbi:negative regulator of transcription subunit 5 [Entomophthora muscae]|uniref:Negative regulator of transcription subunit 5 n=2 Tax=Entomophthora muscae TaxID=34485 RepID=A0ACC2TE60_9FUNG|nr:negative regulator of transcription subunit 5 [Entomophthora muscae]
MTSRKVQAEIDRVAKKIQEGIADFEDTLEKMNASSNPNMVNKYEASLKTEIKKLQRCRDQMKAWIASPEVKDKTFVTDNRKLIESYMERFKAIEKEMKTKAYSKEGLMQSEKIDPKQKEKIRNFRMDFRLSEAEGIGLLPKKKKDHHKVERLNQIKHMVERHKHHINRLELVLRMLANDHVSADKVNEIKDNVAYYVEENQEADFDEDEFMYDELNLDEEEELYAVITEEHQLAQSTLDNNDDETAKLSYLELFVELVKPKSSKSTSKAEDKPQPFPSFKEPAPSKSSASNSKPRAAEVVVPSVPKDTPTEISSETTKSSESLPPLKKTQSLSPKASMKKISVTPSKKEPLPAKSEEVPEKPPTSKNLRSLAEVVSASVPKPAEATQKVKSVPAAAQKPQPVAAPTPPVSGSKPSTVPTPAPVVPEAASSLFTTSAPISILAPVAPQMQERRQVALPATTSSPVPTPRPQASKVESSPPKQPVSMQKYQASAQRVKPAMSNSLKPEASGGKASFPFFLEDLSKTFHETRARVKFYLDMMAKSRSANASAKVVNNALIARSYYERMLETGYHQKIELADLDPPRLYTPMHPHNTPSYYPSQPLASLLDPKLFSCLDQDTLLFIFYYQKSTYQQYLAALELQKRWRFHTKYGMWFRRIAEPELVTSQYEISTFTFFDFNESWAERTEGCLKVFYDQVEEKLPVSTPI